MRFEGSEWSGIGIPAQEGLSSPLSSPARTRRSVIPEWHGSRWWWRRSFPIEEEFPMIQNSTYRRTRRSDVTLAKALGWVSLGLGLTELLAPRSLSRLIGVPSRRRVLRGLGMREIVSGVGILSGRRPGPWLWSRVVGDAMDLGLLLVAAGIGGRTRKSRILLATGSVAAIAALDLLYARRFSGIAQLPAADTTDGSGEHERGPIVVRKTISVSKSPEEAYRFWNDPENLTRYIRRVHSISHVRDNLWRWVVSGPGGATLEWDAEVTERPNEGISWCTTEDSDVLHAGEVTFRPAPGNRGSVVTVEIEYEPPGGRAGALFASMIGASPGQQLAASLLRYRQLLETGEIARTEGQPAGRSRSTSRKCDDRIRV